jgi:hypothetical protein
MVMYFRHLFWIKMPNLYINKELAFSIMDFKMFLWLYFVTV